MSIFNDAEILVTPNGYKAGKLYSIKPDTGAGDFDVVRASDATRINSANIIEVVGADIPRIDYALSGCPSILIEKERTNLVFPSATATTQTVTVIQGTYTLSFYGTGDVTLSGAATGALNGTGANDRVELTFSTTAGGLDLTVSGSVNDWQLEQGEDATSYIPTVASAETRNADEITLTGVSSLIGQTSGSIFFETNYAAPTVIHVMGINATVTNDFCQLFYSATDIELFVNGSSVGALSGTFSFSSLNKIDLGNFQSGSQVNSRLNVFGTIK